MKRSTLTKKRINVNLPVTTIEKMEAEQKRRLPLEFDITDLLIEAAERCYTAMEAKR